MGVYPERCKLWDCRFLIENNGQKYCVYGFKSTPICQFQKDCPIGGPAPLIPSSNQSWESFIQAIITEQPGRVILTNTYDPLFGPVYEINPKRGKH